MGGMIAGVPISGPPGHNGSACAVPAIRSPADTAPTSTADLIDQLRKRLLFFTLLTPLTLGTLGVDRQGDDGTNLVASSI